MLTRVLHPRSEAVFTCLRILTGLMFALHGVQQLFGVLGTSRAEAWRQHWVGALIQLLTGLAIASGLFTSWAGFLASGTMAVAYLQFHWRFAFDANFFPTVNAGELALVYSFLFLFIACRGPGRWSLDALRDGASSATRRNGEGQLA